MEYIMKMAEAVAQQSKQEEEEGSRFKSVFTINGKSILPPLVSAEDSCAALKMILYFRLADDA